MKKLLVALAVAQAMGCACADSASEKAARERHKAWIEKTVDDTIASGKWSDNPQALKDPLLAPFLQPGAFSSMSLSPDGKHIAALLSDGMGTAVAIIDVDSMEMRNILEPALVPPRRVSTRTTVLAHMRSPRMVNWVADDLLAVDFNDGSAIVALDGKEVRDLFAGLRMQIRDASGHASDWAIIQRDDERGHLSRLNIRTGENYSVDIDMPGKLLSWLADSRGNIRVATTMDTAFWSDSTRLTTWMRANGDGRWRKIDDRSILEDTFRPLQIVDVNDHLVVQARNGGDCLGIWDFDPGSKAFVSTLVRNPNSDIVFAQTNDDHSRVVDVESDGLRLERTWFDPRMTKLQASLDASLPDRVNVMLAQQPSARMIVFSYSDVDPGRWYLFEPAAMKMQELVARLPAVPPTQMQPMEALLYPSFDGTQVPAYLTLPGKPTGPLPLVVLVHGGPQTRDRWQWDLDTQVFAAHGYAVFQPQFRGSSGFGKKFEEAGYGQWGQAMQDDITAGVRYLVDQKIADPHRICIVGASYGGYAALWGLVQTPDLYKCGVSLAGVSDLEKELRLDSDISKSAVQREYARSRIGDPALMKTAFDAVSPLQHADRIKAPLLLAHGKLDERVPVSQGREMYDRMRALHKDVRWLEFDDEKHTLWHIQNQRDYYEAVFDLLERTIGKGLVPANAPARP